MIQFTCSQIQFIAKPLFGVWLCFVILYSSNAQAADILEILNPELAELKIENEAICAERQLLDSMALVQTSQEVGAQYRMMRTTSPQSPWIQLDLGENFDVDSITLVPAFMGFESRQPEAFALPPAFRIDASSEPDFVKFQQVYESADTSYQAKNGLPIVVRTDELNTRYIRVTITKLARVTGFWTYAFGEIIVLKGNRNLAIRSKITMENAVNLSPLWHTNFLKDGRTPLGPPIEIDIPDHDGLFTQAASPDSKKWMLLDLGKETKIDELRLFPVHARQGGVMAGYSFPVRFQIDFSNDGGFDETTTVYHSGEKPFPNPGNNPVYLPFENGKARYVKITCLQPMYSNGLRFFGLSEVQVYSGDENVAKNATVKISKVVPNELGERHPQMLVDGYSSYGKILELPEWISKWERYSEIKQEADVSNRKLNEAKRLSQQRLIGLSITIGGGALVVSVFSIYWRRKKQKTEQRKFRELLAQDLHDEIGSNLAAIARLGEVAAIETDQEQTASDWSSVRHLALDCTDSMRETLWLLGARHHQNENLNGRLERTMKRMLPDVQLKWNLTGDVNNLISDRSERELFLAFKEIVANIAKHSKATVVEVTSNYESGDLSMIIVDNGIGFQQIEEANHGMGLSNIKRRISKIGGTMELNTEPERGTEFQLQIPTKA